MGKDLHVFYYPDKQAADDVEAYWSARTDEERAAIEDRYRQAMEVRDEFSQNMARNWDLDYHDYWHGTRAQLKALIKELTETDGSGSSGEEINYEALGNLSRILSECPRDYYITIDNS